MDWKFIYNQLTKHSILKNIRIILFFTKNIIKSRRGTDLVIISLPILIPVFLIIKKTVHDEDAIEASIFSAILIVFLLAYLIIKTNERIMRNSYPDMNVTFDKNRNEFLVIWGLFMLASSLFNAAWYLFLVYFVF